MAALTEIRFAGVADGCEVKAGAAATRALSRLAIVGSGMAGFGLCDRLVRNQAIGDFQLTLFGDEPCVAYDRVNLSKLFSGRTPVDLKLADARWYREHQIELRTGCRIVSIDRQSREIVDVLGDRHRFDQLVLATGSRPWVPPIPGTDSPGVFVYRTLADLQQIDQFVRDRRARVGAVIGGGLLGLEAAQVLVDLGLQTSVIEMAPGLMPRQLDAQAASLLKQRVESLGVHVHVVRRTERIEPLDNGQLRVQFANAADFDVDILIVAAGVRPNDELARQCGLEVGSRGGIVVNESLRTSDPDIYAIGECVCFRQHVYGLVAPCYRMADVLSNRLAGGEDVFEGADESAELKLLGVQVAALGRAIGESRSGVTLTQQDDRGYRKLILEQGRLVGAACVGQWNELPQIRQAIHQQKRLWPNQRSRFRRTGSPWSPGGALPVVEWPGDSVVCSCLGVSKSTLCELVNGGITDPAQLAQASGASTACGSCHALVCELAGGVADRTRVPGARAMFVASIASAALTMLYLLLPPIRFADSVQDAWRNVDLLWRSDLARQITGFTLLALILLGLVFSLRKRTGWFTFGSYGWWRAVHGVLGAAVLVALAVHTGMRMGENLNLVLASVFLGTALLGSFAGIASSLEGQLEGTRAMAIRRWRPRMTRLHAWLFWPLPALIAIHIVSFYWFSD